MRALSVTSTSRFKSSLSFRVSLLPPSFCCCCCCCICCCCWNCCWGIICCGCEGGIICCCCCGCCLCWLRAICWEFSASSSGWKSCRRRFRRRWRAGRETEASEGAADLSRVWVGGACSFRCSCCSGAGWGAWDEFLDWSSPLEDILMVGCVAFLVLLVVIRDGLVGEEA